MQKVQPTFKPLSVTRHVSRISPTIKRDHSGIIIISGNRSIELAIEKNASLNHVILFPFLWTEKSERETRESIYNFTVRLTSHHVWKSANNRHHHIPSIHTYIFSSCSSHSTLFSFILVGTLLTTVISISC